MKQGGNPNNVSKLLFEESYISDKSDNNMDF